MKDIFDVKIKNTDTQKVCLTFRQGDKVILPQKIAVNYSDCSQSFLPVKWDEKEIASIKSEKGEFTVSGIVSPNEYENPFIEQRADPYIFKGPDNFYYFTASYPAFQNVDSGYDRIILRKSETVAGLKQATEHTIWTAHNEGCMSKHIWAPEIHFIKDKWYIFFAAGDKEDIWRIRPYVLMCNGKDPINDTWTECGIMKATDEDDISFSNFSLDMTYFENNGIHYLIWAQIYGDSSLFMATIDPEKPWQLTSKPILLTKPEFPWEIIRFRVNEGASVLKIENKIYVFFSASGTGAEYCMGVVYADKDSDLLDVNSWQKISHPVLQTEDLVNEAGPGHNSFVYDENGALLLVYHARPQEHFTKQCGCYCDESLYDPCRHARIRYVHITKDGVPVINMSDEDIISKENRKVIAEIKIV